MNIYAKPGDKVVYLDKGGRNGETSDARALGLVVGEEYTVVRTAVENWSSEVFLEEFPGVGLNTVMFEDYRYPSDVLEISKESFPLSPVEMTRASDPVAGTLAFFASCIRGGERWDETCQQAYDRAMAELNRIKNWEDTAAQMARNSDYYRGLVVRIGEALGDQAYVSDDGSLQQDVLCAKVPELVEALVKRFPHFDFEMRGDRMVADTSGLNPHPKRMP